MSKTDISPTKGSEKDYQFSKLNNNIYSGIKSHKARLVQTDIHSSLLLQKLL
jgi:hypothetical protein